MLHVQGEVEMLTSFRDEVKSRCPLGFVHALWILNYGGIPPLIALAFRPYRTSRWGMESRDSPQSREVRVCLIARR